MKSKRTFLLLGSFGLPFFLMSLFLSLTRWPQRFNTETADWVALAVCALAGAAQLFFLKCDIWVRCFVALVYCSIMLPVLFLYSLYYIGIVFHQWL